MKLPANYADVRMEQLLQRIQTNYEMAKDERLKLSIIEWLHYASDVIQDLTKGQSYYTRRGSKNGKKPTEKQSGGSLKTGTSESYEGRFNDTMGNYLKDIWKDFC